MKINELNAGFDGNDDLDIFLKEAASTPEFEGVTISRILMTSLGGNNLIHLASIKNLTKICGILHEMGVEINQRGSFGFTPLHEAAEMGHDEVYFYLLNLGADMLIRNEEGMTASEIKELMDDKTGSER